MKINTFLRIVVNHNRGLDTRIGHYLYNIQYDYMGGFWRVIRCPKGWVKGNRAVQYDFCGNAIEPTSDTNWEWRERVPQEIVNWIRGK